TRVPWYLSAMDVCAMPHPGIEYFARHSSPLKLFEYMAAGRAIVASDLPGWRDVVKDGESALLVPPGGSGALAHAIRPLRDGPALRRAVADRARKRVFTTHTWEVRARTILTGLLGEGRLHRSGSPPTQVAGPPL